MKTSFLRLTPALALIATLSLGVAHAQNSASGLTPASPATPAVTKQVDPAKATNHQKHADKTTHHKAAKKNSDTVASQTAKPAAPATTTAPKS